MCTKGEWKIDDMPLPSRKTVTIKCNGKIICELKHTEKAKYYTINDLPELKANAQLIASAPDLLEACNTVKDYFSRTPNVDSARAFSNMLKVLQQAINKAEGR